jgi:hypothetical protein
MFEQKNKKSVDVKKNTQNNLIDEISDNYKQRQTSLEQ